MKKNASIIIGLVIILIIVGCVLFAGKAQKVSVASAEVTVLEKTVVVGQDKESAKEIEEETATVEAGSYLKTGDKGRALIELGKAETVLDYNSEIVLEDTSEDGSSISLFLGATWSRVEKLFDKGEYHEIKTKNTVASVRGTSFGVYYVGDTTRLVVATGTVAFSERNEAGEIIATSTILVNGGEEASRTGSGPIVKIKITEGTKKEAWFIYNTTEEETEDKKPEPAPVTEKKPAPAPTTVQTQTTVTATTPTIPPSGSGSGQSSVDYDYRLKIDSISSETMTEGEETEVTVRGQGFDHVIKVLLDDDEELGYDIVDDDELIIILPDDIDEGVYDLKLRGEGGKSVIAEDSITVIWRTTQTNTSNTQYNPNGY